MHCKIINTTHINMINRLYTRHKYSRYLYKHAIDYMSQYVD